jgi:hypothetical protein
MTTALAPDIFDDTFQFAALRAYLEQASLCGGFPDESATKHRAYALYEQMLAETRAAARQESA